MSLLAKEELLAHQWHIIGIHQAIFIWALLILSVIIGFLVTYGIFFIFTAADDIAFTAGAISGIFCFLVAGVYLAWCGCVFQPSLSPATVAEQNVHTIRVKHKLPKLERLENHYNNEYMYHAHHEDDNLKKHQPTIRYKELFYKTKHNIDKKKSFLSYKNLSYRARTKHGGFHYVRKPKASDTFMPRHYSFQMNKCEYTEEQND